MESLEVRKGLEPEDPIDAFRRNPCEDTLFYISKRAQTPEMLQEIFANPRLPERTSYPLLRLISKKLITPEVCRYAVLRDSRNLHYVPRDYINAEMFTWLFEHGCSLRVIPKNYQSIDMCRTAVESHWSNLEAVASRYKTKDICECALHQSYGSIAFLPVQFITKEVIVEAVNHSLEIIEDAEARHCYISWPIKYVPEDMLSEEIIRLSLSVAPESICDIPAGRISHETAISLVRKDGLMLKHLPAVYRSDRTIIREAIDNNPLAFRYVDNKRKTRKLCEAVFTQAPELMGRILHTFPEKYREGYEEKYSRMVSETQNEILLRNRVPLRLPSFNESNEKAIQVSDSMKMHNLALLDDASVGQVYYVSDIHLEHQLNLTNYTIETVKEKIAEKVSELVDSAPEQDAPLLVAGDVADGLFLARMLYEELESQWGGEIIAVLGNHELWDAYNETDDEVDVIVNRFREYGKTGFQMHILENELLLLYKGTDWVTFSEQDILEADPEELRRVCEKSTFSVLGGIGFSGKNPCYNADAGLYRDKLSREQEISRTAQFEKVYQKVLHCAEDCRMIVLTHTPPEDWTGLELHPKWIYVCGHTHNNRLVLSENGQLCLLNDNQLGYQPCPWALKGFSVEQRTKYDPFANMEDGIHIITAKEYLDFNRCEGINVGRFVRNGQIYVIKCSGIYMFFYKERSISILNGGALSKAEHDLEYYYENLPLYVSQVRRAFTPYYNALKQVSESVKAIGGWGSIHGCIVDIDFFNHVYLDPYDGALKFYYADDMTNKVFYAGIEALVRESPILYTREFILKKLESRESDISLLLAGDENHSLASVPELVLDRTMYGPSRQMRSVQYALENNTIRFWRDAILKLSFPDMESTGFLQ